MWVTLSEKKAYGWLKSDVASSVIFGRAADQADASRLVLMTRAIAALVQNFAHLLVDSLPFFPFIATHSVHRYTYIYVHIYTGEQLYEEFKNCWDLGSKIWGDTWNKKLLWQQLLCNWNCPYEWKDTLIKWSRSPSLQLQKSWAVKVVVFPIQKDLKLSNTCN